jgi:hypothetical protein
MYPVPTNPIPIDLTAESSESLASACTHSVSSALSRQGEDRRVVG